MNVRVTTVSGREASGFGSMPLGNAWSFLSQVVTYDQSLEAMKGLAEKFVQSPAATAEALTRSTSTGNWSRNT
jgi:hypothetical protein